MYCASYGGASELLTVGIQGLEAVSIVGHGTMEQLRVRTTSCGLNSWLLVVMCLVGCRVKLAIRVTTMMLSFWQ